MFMIQDIINNSYHANIFHTRGYVCNSIISKLNKHMLQSTVMHHRVVFYVGLGLCGHAVILVSARPYQCGAVGSEQCS